MSGPGLIGRAAAIHDLAVRRDEIKLRNALANAVRRVHDLYERTCPDCDGKGETREKIGWVNCPRCGGTGYLTERLVAPDVPCPDCNGTGRAPEYGETGWCIRCDGRGRIGAAI